MASWASARGRSATPWTCIRRLRLPDAEHIGSRYPHQVSGGQLQRAMTAMAMACRPDLIIFDEPTTALDVTTQVEVLAAIRDIVEQFNTAAIYITHDLAVVAQMADRIMVLRYGESVEEAPTARDAGQPAARTTPSRYGRCASSQAGAAGRRRVAARHECRLPATATPSRCWSDVTVEVPRGRTVAVVGESGSGKSTLARVITGLLPPMQGEIVFDGEALAAGAQGAQPKDTLRRIQMIYQMPGYGAQSAPDACATSSAGRSSSIAA